MGAKAEQSRGYVRFKTAGGNHFIKKFCFDKRPLDGSPDVMSPSFCKLLDTEPFEGKLGRLSGDSFMSVYEHI